MQYLLIYHVLLKVLSAEHYFKNKVTHTVWLRILLFKVKFHLASAFVVDLADYNKKYTHIQKRCMYKTLFLVNFLFGHYKINGL